MNFNKMIQLKNDNYLKSNNIYKGAIGFVISSSGEYLDALFYNDNIKGDTAYIQVKKDDIQPYDLPVSKELMIYLKTQIKENNLDRKNYFKTLPFKQYDMVKLIVEKDKYAKLNIHKGDTGVVMEDYAVHDYILVDFGTIDGQMKYSKGCISVNIKDIELVNI
ncbi:MAG: hypothetical protein IJS74_02625 [Clostridia bacterium]|nr:hypothetical protein [Clostridia bacterium]